MSRFRQRQLVELCALGAIVFAIFQLFSPWQLVIEIRSTSKGGTPISSLGSGADKDLLAQDGNFNDQEESSRKKDYIEKNFGALEESFIKSIGEPSEHPKRSRDDAIKLLYNIQSESEWLDLVEGHDEHGLMALTQITQRYIYNKQSPAECTGQNFLILNKFPGDDSYGIGAIIQHISDYLSVAIQTNSILLYAEDSPPGEHFIQDPADGGDRTCGRSFDCLFQKLSTCTSTKQQGMESKIQSVFDFQDHANEVELDVEGYLTKYGSPIPPIFEDALKLVQPDITAEMLKYWWRAQAAGYIMRLNGKATTRLKELRLGKDVKQLGIQWDVNGEPQDVTFPFPMPEGTISMHVRHGDKGSEMRLVPFNDYVVRAEKFTAENPLGSWKRAFLSTEDPNVIEQMKSMARITPFSYSGSNSRWTWYWSDIPRLNTSPETQLVEFGNRTDLTIKWILQLVMAVECDVFVGTRGSGWNRLIDSLRCVWLASCKQPFLEVGHENDWAGYGP